MSDVIQIKCPFDGTILSVRNQPGIESKNVTCPICKNSYPFHEYKRVTPGAGRNVAPPTSQQGGGMPGGGGAPVPPPLRHGGGGAPAGGGAAWNRRQPAEEAHTQIPTTNMIVGRLTVERTGESYQLRPGRNIIGRRAQRSSANFMIDTGNSRQMSREHIIIEVSNEPGRGFVHRISLFKERVNDTFVGRDKIMYGDRMVLNHGDRIQLPDAILKFELPEEDATQF